MNNNCIVKLEKNNFNRLRKKYQKFIKLLANNNNNLINLNSNKLNKNDLLLENIRLINDNIENLIYLIEICNSNLQINNNNNYQEDIINNYEAENTINKFKPLMLLYQLIKNN